MPSAGLTRHRTSVPFRDTRLGRVFDIEVAHVIVDEFVHTVGSDAVAARFVDELGFDAVKRFVLKLGAGTAGEFVRKVGADATIEFVQEVD